MRARGVTVTAPSTDTPTGEAPETVCVPIPVDRQPRAGVFAATDIAVAGEGGEESNGSAPSAAKGGTESSVVVEASPVEAVPLPSFLTGDANTPSSRYEAAICEHLEALVDRCEGGWQETMSKRRVMARGFLMEQNAAVGLTCVMLVTSYVLYPLTQTFVCAVVFIVVYAISTSLQGYLFWARMTETKFRTASVIRGVIARWSRRIESMALLRSQTPRERRKVFVQSFAQLPTKAFRMVAAVDDRTYRLKHIHKCLMVRRAKRLDEATLRVRRYTEPSGICKLVDMMGIALEKDAIVLKPLMDKARPPRLPNLLISNNKFDEDDATTDESDGEQDSRTVFGAGNTISVAQHMEFFVNRIFLMLWVLAMLALTGAGILFYLLAKAPFGERVLLGPPVALLGLLPVNCIVLNRLLVLYANVYLDKLFHHLVARRTVSAEDRLPDFSFAATVSVMARVVLGVQPTNGGRNQLLFSTSLVDTLGMATVVAMLDQTGIVTDMVSLPVQVLMLHVNTHPDNSSADDEDDVVGYLTERSKLEARERNREMRRQIKRKKFQEERFLELGLRLSTRNDLAVEFADIRELNRHRSHINPICLCILVHALAKGPSNLETWTEPFRFCDRSLRWGRAMHWIPRACGFRDSVASRYSILARVFQIDTTTKTGHRSSYPEQAISLLAEDADGVLHLFTMGTPFLIAKFCSTHWTGDTVDEFERAEKTEVVFTAKHQWEEGMCLETVALSHRLLPERYRRYVDALPQPSRAGAYAEFFFRDGEEVTDGTGQARRARAGRVPPRESRGLAGSGGGPTAASQALDEDAPLVEENVPQEVDAHRRHARSASLPGLPTLASQTQHAAGASGRPRAASLGDVPALPDWLGREFAEDDMLTTETFVERMATTAHTFLGLVGLRDSVRPNTQQAMNTLSDAGVRCMYFCPGNERQTRSFGGRMGLETDWNCSISLKEGAVALDPHSIRAQMPFGIKSIRKHILHVDPIPLQVSLFSHAHGVATRAMLSILQDNHEVVLAVGSVLSHSNVRSFVQADLSIGVLPTRQGPNESKESVLKHGRIVEPTDFAATNSLNRDLPLYRNVAELIGCSCNLRSPRTTSILPILTVMIRQARLRLSGINNCVEFAMHANVLIVMINAIALVIGCPLLIGPTQTVFELNGFVPTLALCCTYTAHAGMDMMTTMPPRHNFYVRCAIFRHTVTVWCLRYVPSLVAILALGITAATDMCEVDTRQLAHHSSSDCMFAARGYVALTLNYWLMIHCWTHMSRHEPISLTFSLRIGHGRRSTSLFRSFRWAAASALASVMSVVVVLISTPAAMYRRVFYPSTVHFLMALLFPALPLALDWPIKRWRDKRFTLMQKFRKLTFGTRLGMHSPRGDYEPEGVTYSTPSATAEVGAGESRPLTLRKRLVEAFYRYTTMRHGKLELNCVCCDHVGGNYASYHVVAKM